MAINLLKVLSSFEAINDLETETAFFRTHTLWRGEWAYLHTIHKPADSVCLMEASSALKIPKIFVEFLAQQNGASLFSTSISLFGVVPTGTLLNRTKPFSLPPFNIEGENLNWPPADPDRLLGIGGYSFDGSQVCIDRGDFSIHMFKKEKDSLAEAPSFSWASLDDWLIAEIDRLKILFDKRGKLLVDKTETSPLASRHRLV
jgi:hypothetical protein